MDARRAKRKANKRKQIQEEIPCIVFSVDEGELSLKLSGKDIA